MLAIELTYNTSMDFRFLIKNVLLTSHQRLCADLVLGIQQRFLCRFPLTLADEGILHISPVCEKIFYNERESQGGVASY